MISATRSRHPARAEVVRDAARTAPAERAVQRAPSPSAERYRALVEAHFDFIWRSLRGLGVPAGSADDAAQHVFLIAYQKLAEIAPDRERSFLFGTALGVAANARRAGARRRELCDDGAMAAAADDAPNPEQLIEMKQARALLDDVLDAMEEDLRVVFVLFELEGVPTEEIAAMLGLAKGTVASRLRRAREDFRAIARRVQARALHRGGER
ncbi:sigma-70 family RNA polymerase sigma factor [Sorangium sp. So ce327]|jgi:RNA polymerase sigma-70 factor (ECF subfamily)|uniref:RNA polymerase sigma factor n=1 Tax=Sorangium sp. So ce327 TaxID=3133301 RepID=UPI003F62DF17